MGNHREVPLLDYNLQSSHDEMSENHLLVIEAGGSIGKERPVGATLVTGVDTL